MTEDDTFNALRRSPFDQVLLVWMSWHKNYAPYDDEEIVGRYGWTWDEFLEEFYRTASK